MLLWLSVFLSFWNSSPSSFASVPTNLVRDLIQREHIRAYRLRRNTSRATYYSIISSGLPQECQSENRFFPNEANVNILSDPDLSAPLRIQVVGLYPAPLSNLCMMTLSTALTRLPPDTFSVSNNLTALSRGGQLVLDFSIPRPLPPWIVELLPRELGGKTSLPSQSEGLKLMMIGLLFNLIGLRLIFVRR